MLKRNLIANYLGQGWRALMSVAFIPLYVKYLGIEAYGLIGIYAMLQAWLVMFDMGMRPTLNREMARFTGDAHNAQSIRDLLRTIEIISIGVALVVALGIWAASDWLATDWLKVESLSSVVVAQAFVVMGLVTGLSFVKSVYVSSIAGLQKQVLQNIITSVMATAESVGAVAILAWVSPTLEAFFLWQAVISIIMLVWLCIAVYRALPRTKRRARFSPLELMKIWRFAAGMLGITFLALLLSQVDKILLSKLLSLEAFGYYILAANLAQILQVFTAPIVNAFFPRFAQLVSVEDLSKLISTYHIAAQLISVLIGSLAIFLIIFSEPLIFVWTGDEILTERVAPILSVLAFGTLINRMHAAPYRLQLAYGWTSLTLKINMLAVVIIIPLLFFVTPKYGALGAAWVWCVLNLGLFLVVVGLTHRRLLVGEARRWYLRDVFPPLGAALTAALFARFLFPEEPDRLLTVVLLLMTGLFVLSVSTLFADMLRPRLFTYIDKGAKRIAVWRKHKTARPTRPIQNL